MHKILLYNVSSFSPLVFCCDSQTVLSQAQRALPQTNYSQESYVLTKKNQ